jgi:YbgC/YbaW family acyl-CoA thioester hydrolase
MLNKTFVMTKRVEFHETDAAGLIHFSNFYRWMELCEHEWFRSTHLAMMSTSSEGIRRGWPRRDASCSFIRPIRYDDIIRVTAEVIELTNSTITYKFLFQKDRSGKWTEVAHGKMTTVHVKQDSKGRMEAEPFPENVLRALSPTHKNELTI